MRESQHSFTRNIESLVAEVVAKRPKRSRPMQFAGLRGNRVALRRKYKNGEFVTTGLRHRVRLLSAAEITEFQEGIERAMERRK